MSTPAAPALPPAPAPTSAPQPTARIAASSTSTILSQPSKLRDIIERQGATESLPVFAARCRVALASVEAPFNVVLPQLHGLLNEPSKNALSGMLAANQLPTSLDALFDAMLLRLPSTASETEPLQQPGQSVAAFGDDCTRHLCEAFSGAPAEIRDRLGGPIFLAGLRDDVIRRHVITREEEFRISYGSRPAMRSMVE